MDEYLSAEEDDCFYSSDQESFDGIANDDEPVSSSSRRSTTQVSYTLLRSSFYLLVPLCFWFGNCLVCFSSSGFFVSAFRNFGKICTFLK